MIKKRVFEQSPHIDSEEEPLNGVKVRMSLCENLIHNNMSPAKIKKIFDLYEIDKEIFFKNPKEILRKNLMIEIDGKIYDKKIGLPQLLALTTFNEKLN